MAAQIKESGRVQRELTGLELADIMKGVVGGLLTGQDTVKASIPTMSVEIGNQQGVVKGSVSVEKPIKADIGIGLTLGNAQQAQRLRLVALDIQEKAKFPAKMALKAINIKGKAEKALRDPNQALLTALNGQLESRGVQLTGIGLNFGDSALSVDLRGSSK